MALASLFLVVIASLIHATWNLLSKRAAYAPWVFYLLAKGTIIWTPKGVGFVLLSGLIHLAYSLCLQRGYQVADLSVVYPVARGTGPMLSTIGAIFILGETPTGLELAGLGFVVVGIALIATRGDLSAFGRPGGQVGVRWGTGTGGLIATYTVVDAYAVKALGIAPVVLDWFSNLLRFFLLMPLVVADPQRALARMRGFWWVAVGVGLLSPLSYILILAALTAGAPLTLVAPMREMSMMVGALLAIVILRESVGLHRLAGCSVLIVGVLLLSVA